MSSIVNYVADGSTTEFQIPFTYISEAHVVVTIDGTATSAFTFLNSSTLQMNTAPTAGAKVQLQRVTPTGALVDFTDGSTLFETDLDLAHQQNRLIAEESKDIANVAKTTIDNNIADVNTVAGIAAAVSNVSSRGADVTSVADNMAEVLLADTNAATATTKAAEAVVSANTASAQAAISTTKAGESSASAAAALASQNAAQQARTDTDASEALALAYKNSAQTSASTATTKASEASQSATTASSQAAVATAKATEASTDAGIALAQAAVSTTKAAEASTSESNALSYKDTALAASAASETARAASVVAKDASQVAKTASEAARDAAAASQTAAATSETNAAASEGVATTQAGISTTKAGEASTSASNAASSASSAQASKDAALEALDSFDDRYLGQKTADPTVDNDGNALVSGALYFNTTDDIMKVYDGSLWVAAYASLSGAMFGANNLSDVADAAGSRSNLGLGTAATTASTDYATAAQGALADSAIQPNDTPTFAGINTTGNATFGDNDKAIFGAGSDLQIYHSGTASIIKDVGQGSLFLAGASDVYITDDTIAQTMARFTVNGAASLSHSGSTKLFTTSTGIDVTGTVTADGLTVAGGITTTVPTVTLDVVEESSNADGLIGLSAEGSGRSQIRSTHSLGSASDLRLITDVGGSARDRLKIDSNGDISFYEDTGTTPKFFWDASAESLGIGTSSPDNKIVTAGGIAATAPGSYGAGNVSGIYMSYESGSDATILARSVGSASNLLFKVSGVSSTFEAARFDSSGNLLVGKTSTATGAGFEARSDGQIVGTRSANRVAFLNRLTSDGDIVQFAKDGSTVGSIGADDGRVYIESSGGANLAGIGFSRTAVAVEPRKNSGWSNAEVDIGSTTYKFKDAHFSGTVNAANFNTTSDQTLKTNVETLTGSLDAVKSLRGVSFDWLENGGSEIGVIAQEVEAVLPDVVSTNDEGIKSVKYGNMVAVLIEAIKEQQLRIEALEAKLGE